MSHNTQIYNISRNYLDSGALNTIYFDRFDSEISDEKKTHTNEEHTPFKEEENYQN